MATREQLHGWRQRWHLLPSGRQQKPVQVTNFPYRLTCLCLPARICTGGIQDQLLGPLAPRLAIAVFQVGR